MTVYEDEVLYGEWVNDMQKTFNADSLHHSSYIDIPFLPPSLRSLQAFRSLLRLQRRLQLQGPKCLTNDLGDGPFCKRMVLTSELTTVLFCYSFRASER